MTHEHNTSDTIWMQRLEQLEQDNRRICAETAQLHTRFQTAQRRLRVQAGLAFAALIGMVVVAPGSRAAIAQGYGVTLTTLNTRLTAAESNISALQSRTTAVEGKTQFMTVSTEGQATVFSGCNVFIQNGLGATNGYPTDPNNPTLAVTNSLGNLILGYNALSNNLGYNRTGSHNLILGDYNGYSSYGGIVAGYGNTTSSAYATITGGALNVASGVLSSVSGGLSNIASGPQASISGGDLNTASGSASSVGGGADNVAGGFASAVSGGMLTTQSNDFGWSAGSLHSP